MNSKKIINFFKFLIAIAPPVLMFCYLIVDGILKQGFWLIWYNPKIFASILALIISLVIVSSLILSVD